MFSKFLDSLRPKVLADLPSKYNRRVIVKQGWGYTYIHTDDANVTQSGGIVKDVWRPVLKKIAQPNKSWLVFGVAGGTLLQMLSDNYRPLHMTGIEIDPVMINVGKKYFHTDQIPGLTIINTDANTYAKKTKEKFDYVLVDIYIGELLPAFVYSTAFLSALKKLAPIVVVNHLFYSSQNKHTAEELVKTLSTIYPKVSLVRSLANLLLICS